MSINAFLNALHLIQQLKHCRRFITPKKELILCTPYCSESEAEKRVKYRAVLRHT